MCPFCLRYSNLYVDLLTYLGMCLRGFDHGFSLYFTLRYDGGDNINFGVGMERVCGRDDGSWCGGRGRKMDGGCGTVVMVRGDGGDVMSRFG